MVRARTAYREQRPHHNHRVHPPEFDMRESLPEIELMNEIESARSGNEGRDPRLQCESALDDSKNAIRSSGVFIRFVAGSSTVVTSAIPPIQSTTPSTCKTRAAMSPP